MRTSGGPRQHDPFAFTTGLGASACVEELVEAAGVLVQDVPDVAGGGGGVGRRRNTGATPARNITTTSTNGHRLSFAAASQSSVWLTGASSISASPRTASAERRGYARRKERESAARAYLLLTRGDIPLLGAALRGRV